MMSKIRSLSRALCFVVLCSHTLFAQISIDYPTDRVVFQRDNDNKATINISGNYTRQLDRVEAKITAINQGTSTDWQIIQNNVQGGFYSGSISAKGGWYRLEVRGIVGDQVVSSNPVDHVGVGEVFILAGQSNAQGFQDRGAQGAADDRVSCVDYNNTYNYNDTGLPYPNFRHVDANSNIAPRGQSAWAWGRLGDLLAARLGVPILFYNTAFEGTKISSWRESINGTTYSPYVGAPYLPSGIPYINLRWVMQYYVPITGARAVLWEQGEADNQFRTSADDYANDLRTIIEANRNESGKNLAWMVSLTSYNAGSTYAPVIEGQQRVISSVPSVFTGPNTDVIQIPRIDAEKVHFQNEGLTQLGEAWFYQMSDNFFAQTQPYGPTAPVNVRIGCVGNYAVSITADQSGYTSMQWSNGQGGNSITVGNGSYTVTARDDKGNYIYSPQIKINAEIQPAKSIITLEGSNPVCIGNTATLVSSITDNIVWNTGSTSSRIGVTTGGDYFVKTKSVYGCETNSDNYGVSVLNSPLPPKPAITASGATTFCEGGVVTLSSNSALKNVWSNGQINPSIDVRTSGDFRVRALDNVGCYSPESDPITVKVNALPGKPQISLSGATTMCQGDQLTITSNYDTGNIWSNAATSKSILVSTEGKFSVIQKDANGCESVRSDEISTKINPLPATPSITNLRPTTFCERDYTILSSSEAHSYLWSNGSTNRTVETHESGDYTISAKDANGCISIPSPVVKVTKNPLPPTPVITASGPTTFCADLNVSLTAPDASAYIWSNGATSKTILVTKPGTFKVTTINEFQCSSDPSNSVTTQTLPLPESPTIAALGPITFCDGNSVQLEAKGGTLFYWSDGQQGSLIEAKISGNYQAKAKDIYGCFSPFSPTIAVDVKPQPTIPVIKKVGAYTLMAENNINAGEHQWQQNGVDLTQTSTTIKVVSSGIFIVNNSVTYSASLTCMSEFSQPFEFYPEPDSDGMVVFPNPVRNGKIGVETVQNLVNATVQIIDANGVIHKTYKIQKFESQKTFDISDLNAGVFFIRITSAAFNGTKKIVVVN